MTATQSSTGNRPGSATTPPLDLAERQASEADARLLRRVGWRLVAWSGGSTLVVLVALGVALYVSVAASGNATRVAAPHRRPRC